MKNLGKLSSISNKSIIASKAFIFSKNSSKKAGNLKSSNGTRDKIERVSKILQSIKYPIPNPTLSIAEAAIESGTATLPIEDTVLDNPDPMSI